MTFKALFAVAAASSSTYSAEGLSTTSGVATGLVYVPRLYDRQTHHVVLRTSDCEHGTHEKTKRC